MLFARPGSSGCNAYCARAVSLSLSLSLSLCVCVCVTCLLTAMSLHLSWQMNSPFTRWGCVIGCVVEPNKWLLLGSHSGEHLTRRGDLATYPDQATVFATKGFALCMGSFKRGKSVGHPRKTRCESSVRRVRGADTPPLAIDLFGDVGGGARKPSLSDFQIFFEGWISSFSCMFAG